LQNILHERSRVTAPSPSVCDPDIIPLGMRCNYHPPKNSIPPQAAACRLKMPKRACLDLRSHEPSATNVHMTLSALALRLPAAGSLACPPALYGKLHNLKTAPPKRDNHHDIPKNTLPRRRRGRGEAYSVDAATAATAAYSVRIQPLSHGARARRAKNGGGLTDGRNTKSGARCRAAQTGSATRARCSTRTRAIA